MAGNKKTAKYKGSVSFVSIVENGVWNADGASTYSIFNAGNVNVTIDGVAVIVPRGSWEGPSFHPDVAWYSVHKIEFDAANAPTYLTPVGGQYPRSTEVAPGDPIPVDKRVIIFKTNVEPNG
jgi:hypothetical protein